MDLTTNADMNSHHRERPPPLHHSCKSATATSPIMQICHRCLTIAANGDHCLVLVYFLVFCSDLCILFGFVLGFLLYVDSEICPNILQIVLCWFCAGSKI
ncbi:hypothetical protein E2542_SST21733 [Spatholobus suberectus]|nr:hypothetical protein E2542_SST21733 [Spatholobus suberectus]